MLAFGKSFASNLLSNPDGQSSSPIVIELVGDVGAGKTTFVRGLAEGLDVKKPITSPSFTISKSYALPNSHGRLIHYDFYRLSSPGLMSADLQEALENPNNIIIIEWGKSILTLLPKNHITISITKTDFNSRKIEVSNPQTNRLSGISQPKPIQSTIHHRLNHPVLHTSEPGVQLYLDTSTPTTILRLNNLEYTEPFGHALAEKLLDFIHAKLQNNHRDWQDITKITFMSGPGSFTGLRIGAAIVNTLASELNIPLYDHHNHKHRLIIPEYGRAANISKPKK